MIEVCFKCNGHGANLVPDKVSTRVGGSLLGRVKLAIGAREQAQLIIKLSPQYLSPRTP